MSIVNPLQNIALVVDRTDSDVTALAALKDKIIKRTATTEEITLWLTSNKGAYNASDLNRVGVAIQYLADELNELGIITTVNVKTDWNESDIPTSEQMDNYLLAVSIIRDALPTPSSMPAAPSSMFKLNTTKANNIEKILELVNTMVVSIQSLWRYSAAAFSICGFGGMV